MERILLSTYILKIQDNNKNDQILSHFNGTDDFLIVLKNYLTEIYSNILETSDIRETTSLHLTLEAPASEDLTNRKIFGFFSSGVSGEEYEIKDVSSRERILEVQRNHAAFRNLFFYVHIPRGRNFGALIIQRKSKFGVKNHF
jgi:hypothetical protein